MFVVYACLYTWWPIFESSVRKSSNRTWGPLLTPRFPVSNMTSTCNELATLTTIFAILDCQTHYDPSEINSQNFFHPKIFNYEGHRLSELNSTNSGCKVQNADFSIHENFWPFVFTFLEGIILKARTMTLTMTRQVLCTKFCSFIGWIETVDINTG